MKLNNKKKLVETILKRRYSQSGKTDQQLGMLAAKS